MCKGKRPHAEVLPAALEVQLEHLCIRKLRHSSRSAEREREGGRESEERENSEHVSLRLYSYDIN